ncbi:hypothetical protein [Halomicrococcus sp. SG-WS-1]|uniref:hypothetical protein n=1 Tax=Halomicrococcus sp. SG-WS-1 TaxID=3439057 RepID=UPI003F7AE384
MLDALRNPEHTGENRCWPCTAVNGALLAFACAGIGLWSPARRTVRGLAALALGTVGSGVIALRGYVVPGTPRFAPRFVAALPGIDDPHAAGPSDSSPDDPGSLASGADDATGERAADALVDAGVLHAVGDTVHLDERFRERWRAAMADVRNEDLATAVRSVAEHAETVETVEEGRWVVLSGGGPASETWLPRPVAVAEVAAVRALADDGVPVALRAPAASALRTFLQDCPACDVPLAETTTDDCCGSATTNPMAPPETVLACPDCGQRSVTLD